MAAESPVGRLGSPRALQTSSPTGSGAVDGSLAKPRQILGWDAHGGAAPDEGEPIDVIRQWSAQQAIAEIRAEMVAIPQQEVVASAHVLLPHRVDDAFDVAHGEM